jgi:RHS repeat-associated protein
MLSVFMLSLVPARPAHADTVGGEDTDVTPVSHGVGGPHTMGQPSGAPGSADALITADPVTGAARTSVSFDLPKARGGAQPSLSLSYNSATGMGMGGMGWTLDLPSIERRNSSSFPTFVNLDAGVPPGPPVNPATDPDDFVLDGQPLVPICILDASGTCGDGDESGSFPTWLSGWTYYHPAVDTFERAFRSADYSTWVVQTKAGQWLVFGTALDGNACGGLETHAAGSPDAGGSISGVYRWDLVEVDDASMSNRVLYNWASLGPTDLEEPASNGDGLRYLTDIYDTFPGGRYLATPSQAAHHTHLFWRGSDEVLPYSPGWKSTPARVLGDVAVSSVTISGAPGSARSLVRLYHLTYTLDTAYEQRFLTEFQQYGCTATETNGNIADPTTWAYAGACPSLPATNFYYQNPINDGWPSRSIVKVNTQTISGFTTGYTSAAMVDVDGDGISDLLASNGPQENEPYGSTAVVMLGSNPSVQISATPDTTDNGGPRYAYPGDLLPTLRSYWGDWWGTSQQSLLFLNTSCGDPGYVTTNNSAMPGPVGDGVTFEIYQFGGPSGAVWPGSGPVWDQSASLPFNNAAPPDYTESEDNNRNWEQGKVFDIDGDGLTDIAQIPDSNPPFSGARRTYFSLRPMSGANQTTIFARKVFSEGLANYNTSGYHAIADMDADGLADIVEVEPITFSSSTYLRWWKNRGDGRFGDVGNANYAAETAMPPANDVPVATCTACNWPVNQHSSNIAVGDVNGDSLADFVVLYNQTLSVYTQLPRAYAAQNNGAAFGAPITYANAAPNDNSVVSIATADGTGMPFIVLQNVNTVTTFQLQSATPQFEKYGLLTGVQQNLSRQTTVTYDSVAHLGQIASTTWQTKLPVPTMVVTSSTTSGGPGEPDGTFDTYVTNFAYQDPYYDARDHAFVGFRVVTTTTQGNAASPGTVTTTTYVPPVCGSGPCGSIDYGWRSFRGLPYEVQVSDASSQQVLSTTLTTWSYAQTHVGLDGRYARMVYPQEVDTFVADPTAPSTTTTTVGGVVAVEPQDNAYVFSPGKLTVPAGAALRRTQGLDTMGDAKWSIDFGVVGQDTPIETVTVWSLGTGDTSGWFYRPTQVQTGYAAPVGTSYALTGTYREVDYTYNQYGLVTGMTAPLSGTLPLSRSGGGAPAPANASVNSSAVQLATYTYETTFWNVTQVQGPDGRCTGYTYDSAYDELPVTIAAYADGCGRAALTTTLSYDRGLGLVTMSVDPTLAQTTRQYDPLGRLTEIDPPSAISTLLSDPAGAEKIDWSLYPAAVHITTPARESYVDFDAFGRQRARFDSSETSGTWIVSGVMQLYPSGRVQKAYQPFLTTLSPSDVGIGPTSASSSFTYDALGRVKTSTGPDGVATGGFVYHPLSTVVTDGDQLPGGGRVGSSSTLQYDGHGRTVSSIQTLANGPVDTITTAMTYLATGEVTTITKTHTANASSYSRTMTYDSLGRLVENQEPNTSFHDVIGVGSKAKVYNGAWLYAYDDAGDLVGTSDARGCGENRTYDNLGRLTSEDYSPCAGGQAGYSAPSGSTGYEAWYVYDVSEDSAGTPEPGKLTAVYDRAQHTQISYDARGRPIAVRKQLAPPGLTSAVPGSTTAYTPHWFEQDVTLYDEANRVVTRTTGADPAVFGLSASTYLTSNYTARGTVSSVNGSYGTLLASQTYNPDGTVLQQVLGDVASTTADYTYYLTGRVETVHVHRPTGPWAQGAGYTTPPSTNLEDNLEQLTILYDAVGNPYQFSDASTAVWPTGAKPQAYRGLTYGDDYRLTQVETQYASGASVYDAFLDPPYAPEVAAGSNEFPALQPASDRVYQQSFAYDFLGNMTSSSDDANVFVDRSLGTITNGGTVESNAPAGPNQLRAATLGGSNLSATYDDAGNVQGIRITRAAPCSGSCNTFYAYSWDELGRMATAVRTEDDATGALYTPVQGLFTYDASGHRVLQAYTSTASSTASADPATYTADVFDSLRLEGTTYPDANGDYARSETTEAVLLVANGATFGRVVYSQADPTLSASGTEHVFLEIGDHLGSTSFVIDQATSELVEHPTYQAFGAAESDLRSARWASFREVFRHSGHEDGAQVGLTYFGQRYYSPLIGRWMSPDPLAIHALGSDLNPYAYVGGSPMRFVDPLGLDGCDSMNATCSSAGGDEDGSGFGDSGADPGFYASGSSTPGIATSNSVTIPGPEYSGHWSPSPPPAPAQTAQNGGGSSWIAAAGSAIAGGARSALGAWNVMRTRLGNALFDKQAYDASVRANLPSVPVNPLTEGIVQDTPEVAGGLLLVAAGGVGTGAVGDGLAMADTAAVQGVRAAEGTEALVARAEQIHGALDTTAQGMRTTAVLDTSAGRIVASGGRDLTPGQKALLQAGEMFNNAPGVHAEVTAITGARQIGAQLQAIGTTRDFCPFCIDYIEQSGGVITGPRTAVWPQ